MPVIQWSEALHLGDAATDANHAAFCTLLNAVADASEADFVPALDAFIAHTEVHFAEENAWMEAADFPRSTAIATSTTTCSRCAAKSAGAPPTATWRWAGGWSRNCPNGSPSMWT